MAKSYKILTVAKTVTTAGTRVALSSTPLLVNHFILQAKYANTGSIYIGDVTVASTTGIDVRAGASYSSGDILSASGQNQFDLATVYIDSSVNGEGVWLLYTVGN